MTTNPADILMTLEHRDFDLAVPTPDHFIPLLYIAGLAAAGDGATEIIRGYAMGSLSMSSYGIGMDGVPCKNGEGASPLPKGIPGDQTNT